VTGQSGTAVVAPVDEPSTTIRWAAWAGDRDLPISFPAGWALTVCPPHDAPDLGADEIARAVTNPIGSPRLSELAAGKQRPCIVIDDLTRPTRGHLLVPPILDELQRASIPASDVLVLAGVANHRPMLHDDLVLKLGADVLSRCRVLNHFSFDNCTYIGDTSEGTPVEINNDFLASDLRILVGSIIPHGAAGFSGGAKLLMPGIASARSALAYHRGSATRGRWAAEETPARLESEEAARMAGVDFIVNSVPTSRLGVGAVVAGDVVAAHRAGVQHARRIFASPTPAGLDVCVLSLYPKDGEFLQHITALSPWLTAPEPIVREGGTVVVTVAGGEGFGVHALFGPGMPLQAGRATRLRGRDLVFLCPTLEAGELPDRIRDDTVLLPTWDATRQWLEAKHGAQASVAVYPCATMQLAAAVC
jgi:nickel-dependent lactate racemase